VAQPLPPRPTTASPARGARGQLRRRRCLVVGPTCKPHPHAHVHLLHPTHVFSLPPRSSPLSLLHLARLHGTAAVALVCSALVPRRAPSLSSLAPSSWVPLKRGQAARGSTRPGARSSAHGTRPELGRRAARSPGARLAPGAALARGKRPRRGAWRATLPLPSALPSPAHSPARGAPDAAPAACAMRLALDAAPAACAVWSAHRRGPCCLRAACPARPPIRRSLPAAWRPCARCDSSTAHDAQRAARPRRGSFAVHLRGLLAVAPARPARGAPGPGVCGLARSQLDRRCSYYYYYLLEFIFILRIEHRWIT
jgi:hypothetical protein